MKKLTILELWLMKFKVKLSASSYRLNKITIMISSKKKIIVLKLSFLAI